MKTADQLCNNVSVNGTVYGNQKLILLLLYYEDEAFNKSPFYQYILFSSFSVQIFVESTFRMYIIMTVNSIHG